MSLVLIHRHGTFPSLARKQEKPRNQGRLKYAASTTCILQMQETAYPRGQLAIVWTRHRKVSLVVNRPLSYNNLHRTTTRTFCVYDDPILIGSSFILRRVFSTVFADEFNLWYSLSRHSCA